MCQIFHNCYFIQTSYLFRVHIIYRSTLYSKHLLFVRRVAFCRCQPPKGKSCDPHFEHFTGSETTIFRVCIGVGHVLDAGFYYTRMFLSAFPWENLSSRRHTFIGKTLKTVKGVRVVARTMIVILFPRNKYSFERTLTNRRPTCIILSKERLC